MTRTKPKSVSHVSTVASPLSDDALAAIRKKLTDRKLPAASVTDMVRRINGAIVQAYILEPQMATRGQRQKWFTDVHDAIGQVTDILSAASRRTSGDIEFANSEDMAVLDGAFCRYLRLEHTPDITASALQALVSACDEQIEALGQDKRSDGKRQRLANFLARDWFSCFDDMPTASASESRRGIKLSPFVELIQDLDVHNSERITTPDSCRLVAERAIKYAQDQHAMELRKADK